MTFEQVRKILPQKFPFIMVDTVLEIVPNDHIVCLKNITGNEFVFSGHFPEKAVFPGAYITEALAQTSILLFYEKKEKDTLFLLYSVKLKFKKQVVPGDQLLLNVTAQKLSSTGAIVAAKATVSDEIVAEGELILSFSKNVEESVVD